MTHFPTLDPEFAAAVAMMPEPDYDTIDLPAAREAMNQATDAALAELSYDGVTVRELAVAEAAIRLLTPDSASEDTGPLPVLLWIHGGSFALGRAKDSDAFALTLVRTWGMAVASVDYRLAPEVPFPGAHDDCYAALTYLYHHAAELGLDPDRIAVGGESAGGCLAASTVLRARDEGQIPIAAQLLDIPVLDSRMSTESMREFVDTPVFNRPSAEFMWRFYLGDHGVDNADASPALATDLSGLPRTYISMMELDPLRDEAIAYGLRLLQAGVSVEMHCFPGTFHGSSAFPSAVSDRHQTELVMAARPSTTVTNSSRAER